MVHKQVKKIKTSEDINRKRDPMGRAISDYFTTGKAAKLRVFSPMFEEDEIPVPTLFRTFEEMPETERKALDLAKGRTLDVGAGSGCHSLVLQQRGIDVTAIDISHLSVLTMQQRGVKKVLEQDFCILLTIRDPSGKAPVYTEITQQLQEKNFVYSNVRLKNEVREHVRVEGESNG